MKIIHLLSSVDLTKRTGVFSYRTDKCTELITICVSLSALLCWRITNKLKNKREKLPLNVGYVNHTFVSELNSPEYVDSPFRVVYFQPDKGSDVPANFKLECVDEHGEAVKDVILNKIVGYKDSIRHASNYMRYELRTVKRMMTDVSANIVEMNLVRSPVV